MLGRGHTNQNEASHNILIRFRPKHSQITRLHYHVSTNLSLLQSNTTYMNRVRGMGYHWLPDLLQRMGRPLLHGVEAVLMSKGLRCLSIAKLKQLKRRKSGGSLNTGVQIKKKKTTTNERSGDNLKIQHSYGDEDDEEPFVSAPTRSTQKREKSCRCGSTSCSCTTHHDCLYNKNKGGSVEVKCPLSLQAGTVKLG